MNNKCTECGGWDVDRIQVCKKHSGSNSLLIDGLAGMAEKAETRQKYEMLQLLAEMLPKLETDQVAEIFDYTARRVHIGGDSHSLGQLTPWVTGRGRLMDWSGARWRSGSPDC